MSEDRRDPGAAATARGVLVIVVAGVAVGLLNNAIGLASKPARGLQWVKRVEAMARLEDVAARPDSVVLPAAPATVAPTPSPSPARTPLSAPGGRAVSPVPTPRGRAAAPASPAPATPSPAPSSAAPAAAAPDLPVVPDVDRPVAIALPALKRFYDANACVVIDARESQEYADGHIAGALSLPYNDALAEPERLQKLGENGRPIVVYCGGGACELSMDLARFMLGNGRKRVLVYEGGWPEWRAAGFPVASGAAAGGR
jgi:rhodanese-related sulfurtransferase